MFILHIYSHSEKKFTEWLAIAVSPTILEKGKRNKFSYSGSHMSMDQNHLEDLFLKSHYFCDHPWNFWFRMNSCGTASVIYILASYQALVVTLQSVNHIFSTAVLQAFLWLAVQSITAGVWWSAIIGLSFKMIRRAGFLNLVLSQIDVIGHKVETVVAGQLPVNNHYLKST